MNIYKNITVGELRKALGQFDDSMPVALSRDEEGNTYHPWVELSITDLSLDEEKNDLRLVLYPLNSPEDVY